MLVQWLFVISGDICPLHTKVDEEKIIWQHFAKMAVIVAVFICFTWNRQLYHKNEIIADLKENITEEANAIRYGEKDLPEGKLKRELPRARKTSDCLCKRKGQVLFEGICRK